MKPKRIILIRHGESEANVDMNFHAIKPNYAAELTEIGRKQAQEAGEKLKEIIQNETAFFYVSPFWRTRQTFEGIVSKLPTKNIKFREEPRLREQEWGHLRDAELCVKTEQERDSYGTFYFRLPDGESAADVFDRVSDFFGTLFRDFDKPDYPENTVIVSHGMTVRLFLMRWFHLTVEQFEEIANPKNCEMIVLEKGDNGKYFLTTELRKHEVYHKYQMPLQISDNEFV